MRSNGNAGGAVNEIELHHDDTMSPLDPSRPFRLAKREFTHIYCSNPKISPKLVVGQDKHICSPLICEIIAAGADIIWANSKDPAGLLGRPDLKVRTAIGVPICSAGNAGDFVLLLFSTRYKESSPATTKFLSDLARAASGLISGIRAAGQASAPAASKDRQGSLTCSARETNGDSNDSLPLLRALMGSLAGQNLLVKSIPFVTNISTGGESIPRGSLRFKVRRAT